MRRDANHRVDHTGLEPVVIIDFGAREERWPMDQVRAAAPVVRELPEGRELTDHAAAPGD